MIIVKVNIIIVLFIIITGHPHGIKVLPGSERSRQSQHCHHHCHCCFSSLPLSLIASIVIVNSVIVIIITRHPLGIKVLSGSERSHLRHHQSEINLIGNAEVEGEIFMFTFPFFKVSQAHDKGSDSKEMTVQKMRTSFHFHFRLHFHSHHHQKKFS